MSESGILAFGAYVPKRRLQRAAIFAANAWFAGGLKGLAKGERAIGNWDEDAITMGVEAARDCLSGVDRALVEGVILASTTLPFADRQNSGVVKEALNLHDDVTALDVTGSLRAGTSALIQALGSNRTQLVTSAELRKARAASDTELLQGDAGAALLVGQGDVIARLRGQHSVTIDFVDHYRATGADFDYSGEARWMRDEGYGRLMASALKDALAKFGVNGSTISHAIFPIAVRGVPDSLAKRTGIASAAVADTLQATIGDAGAAHPLLMLANVLEKAKPGELILLTSFGQGVDVLLFEATEALARLATRRGVAGHLAIREEDNNYMRFLFHRGIVEVERGARAEIDQKQQGTTLYRNRKAVLGLVGGRCTKTGTVQFPRSEVSVNPNDRAQGTQVDYPLADKKAKVVTFTADALTYSPDPPSYYGTIDFEGGGRMVAEFAEVGAGEIEVGTEVRMVFRVKAVDEQRHFTRYFWRAVPVGGEK